MASRPPLIPRLAREPPYSGGGVNLMARPMN
ncbi:hypothetical protein BgramDRAFT_0223 [Paraburkholderia graminis C4D1M]|jgi:hypothetical protein|uniref:Uncharacterized protein n=1 Tax=Paraburkholderia graminis (strain ATCC 700544 / DSM 17151 / LMG 18924 / NCIMB 13744 / C4D1M) TaxID=396598 RepID=B1FSV1_PARG4|nr:hypothetical protein BgramDRAFT_0223 [Paraburkholderia graminis C4D1M]